MRFEKTILVMIIAAVLILPVGAAAQGIWRVDDDGVDYPGADFTHPQDAVNAAAPGDTILVYPGTYGTRVYTGGVHDTPDYFWGFLWVTYSEAPPLVVYKDGLDIRAVNPDPSLTIIYNTSEKYIEPVAIQASTGGTWSGGGYVGAGVNPTHLTASNAVTILASNVTIDGFTIRSTSSTVSWTAGVMIGTLNIYSGLPDIYTGAANSNTVSDCDFPTGQCLAVVIWHSSGNTIIGNTIDNTVTNHSDAIHISDGFSIAQVNLASGSRFNRVQDNSITLGGIFVGATMHSELPTTADPIYWTDNSGTRIIRNNCMYISSSYSKGFKLFAANILGTTVYTNYASGVRAVGNR